jgi:hypothetical protein
LSRLRVDEFQRAPLVDAGEQRLSATQEQRVNDQT